MEQILNWNAIFEKAKESFLPIKPQKKGSGIKRSGEGIKRGAGIKQGGFKISKPKTLKGGAYSDICYVCKYSGYRAIQKNGAKYMKEHLMDYHGLDGKEAEAVRDQWKAKLNDEPESKTFETDDKKLDKVAKKDAINMKNPGKKLKKLSKEGLDILNTSRKLIGMSEITPEEKEDPTVPPAPPLPPELASVVQTQEAIKKVKTKETKREKKLQDEAKKILEDSSKASKEPGIADLMKLMKAQKGELPSEQKTELADLGKATVRKIKTKEAKSKSSKADKAVIDTKFKELKKSKIKASELPTTKPIKRARAMRKQSTDKKRGGKKSPILIMS